MTRLPTLAIRTPRLLIEGQAPGFPATFRQHLQAADRADIALTRLRIATLRLRRRDLAKLGGIRLLLAELTTSAWEVETHRALLDDRREPVLRALIRRLEEGELEIRAAPLAAWAPDFTVFHREGRDPRALLGPHWLEPTPGQRGPRFAFLVDGADADRVAERFARVWASAYDVGPAVGRLLGGTLGALDRLTHSASRGYRSGSPRSGGTASLAQSVRAPDC